MAKLKQQRNHTNRFSQMVQISLSLVLLLGILQLFLEDLSLVARWPWSIRQYLVFSAIIIDSMLTLEFGIRAGNALVHKNLRHYLISCFGWIDLIASLPLLVFDSGPRLLAVLSGVAISGSMVGVFGLFRLIRFVRVIRIVRLTRLLKATENFKSSGRKKIVVTQVDDRSINSETNLGLIVVGGVLISALVFSILVDIVGFRGTQPALEAHYNGIIQELSDKDLIASPNLTYAKTLSSINPGILGISQRGRVIYTRESAGFRNHQYGVLDYKYVLISETETEFYISTLDFQADDALKSLLLFVLSLVLLQLLYFFGPSHKSES
jgi:hypothetical protein